MKKIAISFACVLFAAFGLLAQDKIEVKTIDGVPHVLNPAKPLRGTVKVEIERTRTIDPYEQPEVGLKYILYSRDEAGNVVLYDPNNAEGQRFGPDGKYLGLLTKIGQGPGEFSAMQGYRVAFLGSNIWVYGGQKVALLDKDGIFKEERKLTNHFYEGIEGGDFFTENTTRNEKKDLLRTLRFVRCTMGGEEKAIDLLQGENIGMVRDASTGRGFSEGWGTPKFFYGGDSSLERVYCGFNTEYRVKVKDYQGRDLFAIERPYEYVKVSRSDVAKIWPGALDDERSKWIISAYPSRLVAIKEVQRLPGGFLAVFRVSGIKEIEVDVFDEKGQYQYALEFPSDVNMAYMKFLAFGFAAMESEGDYMVYHEYKIKNLPEVFGR
jgi:hypothetical protein